MSTAARANPVEESSDTATPFADITLTASTKTQLTTADTPCRAVVVASDPGNTAGVYIRVGDSSVDGTHGQKLAPGQSYTVTISNARSVWFWSNGTAQVVQATVFA